MATNLFLDCEWADPDAKQLVSLALVSEDGRHVFYAERDPLPENPTQFVREIVYPLLERGRALNDGLFTTRLRAFLASIEGPVILFDAQEDINLLRQALVGFNLTPDARANYGPLPTMAAQPIGNNGLFHMLVEDWFDSHSDARATRHHARVDANALRMAWLVIQRKDEGVWSATVRVMKSFGLSGK